MEKGQMFYHYQQGNLQSEELHGVGVFFKDENGTIFHTYSTYSRGLDMVNGAYHYLDLDPKGRDEDQLSWTMEWLRHHDKYEDSHEMEGPCH